MAASQTLRAGGDVAHHDADGRIVGYAARVEHNGADGRREKHVLPITYRRLERAKGYRHAWRARALPAPRPLYRLPELLAAADSPVIVTEGEKKADLIPQMFRGYVGTTSMGGANAAKLSDWAVLAGRNVIIWPDRDEPGRRYADDVAASAIAAVAGSVGIVAVPGDWPEGWDIADPLPQGVAPKCSANC
jgi:putative DNA primase/helicase